MASFNEAQNQYADEVRKQYGWHFLAKEIADYTNCTFFEIMDRPAVEVLSILMIMQAKASISNVSKKIE